MKQLKSSFHDLHRIFQHSITAREIAEPLVSFEEDHPASKVRSFMEEMEFDVVGVREKGVITGYVLKESLKTGAVGRYKVTFKEGEVINESDPLLDTLESLKSAHWVFIRFLGNPSGIVTRGDLQKAPMRMWLFGLISLLEMQLLRRIRDAYPGDEWAKYLAPKRLESARKLYCERQRRNDSVDLAECLQLSDKKTIFAKSKTLFRVLDFGSKRDWNSFMVKVDNLRNRLAHSNGIPSASWPEISTLIHGVEECLTGLEQGG